MLRIALAVYFRLVVYTLSGLGSHLWTSRQFNFRGIYILEEFTISSSSSTCSPLTFSNRKVYGTCMLLPVMEKSFLVLVLLMICTGFSLSGELNKQEVNEDDFYEFEFDFEEEESDDDQSILFGNDILYNFFSFSMLTTEVGTTEDDIEEGDFDGDEVLRVIFINISSILFFNALE